MFGENPSTSRTRKLIPGEILVWFCIHDLLYSCKSMPVRLIRESNVMQVHYEGLNNEGNVAQFRKSIF